MAELGTFALLLAIPASVWAVVGGALGVRWRRPRLVASAEGALQAVALAVGVAVVILLVALAGRDFTVEYVAQHTDRSLSTVYAISAFWAGQGGSLLLWAALLAAAAVALTGRRRERLGIGATAVSVLAAVSLLFVVLVLVENPFRRQVAPADGQGLNPLLQNYAQLLHPVATYLGFVGFTVPFALVVAALVQRRSQGRGTGWVRVADTWTLWSWTALTLGMVLGARWAYGELGWGGYWAWDPVENASLLPWLTGTALLHTGVADRRSGRLRLGGTVLAGTTFLLCVFGTFLTRSGVVSSVHAFGDSGVGPVLAVGILTGLLVIGGLTVWRLPELAAASRSRGRRMSRSMLVGLLSLIGVAVFWGTLYPVVVRGLSGQEVSIGRRFFEGAVTPMGLALLALFAVAPVSRRRPGRQRQRAAGLVAAGAVAVGGAVLAVTGGGHPVAALVAGLSASALVTVGQQLVRRVRQVLAAGARTTAVAHAASPYLAHLGVIVLLAAVTVHGGFQRQARVELTAGGSAVAGTHRVYLDDLTGQAGADSVTFLARIRVAPAGGGRGVPVEARQVAFANQEQPTAEVGIRAGLTGDLYVVLEAADLDRRTATLTVFDNPAVPWIWVGGWLLLAAGLLAATPRTARRPSPPPAPDPGTRPPDAGDEPEAGADAEAEATTSAVFAGGAVLAGTASAEGGRDR